MEHPYDKEIRVQIKYPGTQWLRPKGTHFYIGLYSKNKHLFLTHHWYECINIWYVTSFVHSFIKKNIYDKNQVSDTGPLGLLLTRPHQIYTIMSS